MHIETFKTYLESKGYSLNTIRAYCFAVQNYYESFETISEYNLHAYLNGLKGKYSGSTINLRISALNTYITSINSEIDPIKHISIKKTSYLENVISAEELTLLKCRLKDDSRESVYFLIRFMASTGMRISEVLELKVENVREGYFDICSKGNKERRVFIPLPLAREAISWLYSVKRYSGYVFLNRFGKQLSASGARYLLHYYAEQYGISKDHAHPHSLRHRFALNFLSVCQDISMLSDLLGHSNIETTRIYLRQTRDEQKRMIDNIVTW